MGSVAPAAALAALAASVAAAAPGVALPAPSCRPPQPAPAPGGNVVVTYSGLASAEGHGIAATIAPLQAPAVSDGGFVAVWVGVFASPGWLQVGFVTSRSGDTTTSRTYLEYQRPDSWVCYVGLALDPAVGHRLAVLESARGSHSWRVWVDGKPRPETVRLPVRNSDLVLEATVESKVAQRTLTNSYAYTFTGVRSARAPGGVWRPISEPKPLGTIQLAPTAEDFTARSG